MMSACFWLISRRSNPKCLRLIAAEQTQADRLAVHGRNRRNADVDVLAVGLQIDPAVLRQTAFGDVHVRHDFQARDDRRLQQPQLRRHRDFVQNAVDPITNAQDRSRAARREYRSRAR